MNTITQLSSRREFLRQSALLAGSAIVSANAFGNIQIGKKTKVIVIGGGFAGLAAAYALRKKNVDVTVIESRNRLGGRVFSHVIDPVQNLTVELGAEWVGNSHTRIRELCDEFKLELLNNQFDTHLIYKNQYSKTTDWDFSDDWKGKFKVLLKQYQTMTDQDKLHLDQMDWWRYLVNNGCEGKDLILRELLDSTDFGESIRHVSAFIALATFAESSEKNEMDLKIKNGNAQLAKKLAEQIGQENIFTGHKVTKIEQKENVIVHCENGKTFEADKLICAIPTFAIKNIQWEPGMPDEKTRALNELQYARINKNALLFNKRFWEAENFDMITDQVPHYFYHATKNQPSAKGVLISYTIGEKAELIANQNDEWRKEMIHQTLNPFFGDVRGMLQSQANYYWGTDNISQGAYAMYGINQWHTTRPALQKPFLHTHFAGEHLADWQGFMEGALVSGETAALEVIGA
ncbi:flavin monoamine oxidase family protein [Dyadobacter pollutisoli]|uniref:Tryptophan 2-monooxygenase n=1 Tax=Dyadobacter pollutisoli TaxID=2910158 RepID=A0A9E8N6Y9_9BACT|nr:NAD(P)/FAD-dependent oxidoreductase [Dyadobacter pollutisoli]WAC09682.1 NAD(P)/FAD-dependent oxidoreductase [Dyadobacter pollutisoli]